MKFPKDPQRAFDEAQHVVAERQQVRNLMALTSTRLQAIDAELTADFERWSLEEAEAALQHGVRPTNPTAASRSRQSLTEEKASLTARIAGLQTKLKASEDDVLQKSAVFTAIRSEFTQQKFAEFNTEYVKAAHAFVTVARRGIALADGLNSNLPGLARIRIPEPADGLAQVITLEESRYENGAWIQSIPRDAVAESLFNELAPIAQASAAINRQAAEIRKQRDEEQRARNAAEAENRPQTAAIQYSSISQKAEEERQASRRVIKSEFIGAKMYPNDPEKQTVQFAHLNKDAADKVS